MAQHILDLLRGFVSEYGYWAIALALLLENAGLPIPGETILLLASFTAFSERRLHLPIIVIVGTTAATLGDNLGFAIGHYGGRALLARYVKRFRVSVATVHRSELLFQRYGAATVFFARFVAGLRIIAGPLAGVLRMPWKRFVVFNFLGATVWVTVISAIGYLFGSHLDTLIRLVKRLDLLLAVGAAIIAVCLWRRFTRTGH